MSEASKPRIAVVDDDQGILDSLRFLLEVHDHPVQTFGSAAEFLEAKASEFAGLILDQHMPNMTGLELVERLCVRGIAIPVMLVTGSPSPVIVARAKELGIDRVFEKPPMEEDILDFISSKCS